MAIILGIDPGSQVLGYAFLETGLRGKPRLVCMDVLDLRKTLEQSLKLHSIFEDLQRLIALYAPTQGAVEAPFYGKDPQAMLKLGRCQGVAMLCMSLNSLEPKEYSPKEVKKAVTGKGQASKEQVAKMLPHLVDGQIVHKMYDAYDALAVAYCHYLGGSQSSLGGAKKKHSDWGSFLKDNPNRLDG